MALSISEVVDARLGESSGGKENPPRVIPVMGLVLDDYHEVVGVTDNVPYAVMFIPANASDQGYRIEEDSNGTIITISADNEVVAVAEGQARITFISDDGGYSAVLLVDVKDKLVYLTSVVINEAPKDLHINDQIQLTTTLLPPDADAVELNWTSSDSTIATVDQAGLVIARQLGDFVITADAPIDPSLPPGTEVKGTWTSKVVEPPAKVTGINVTVDKTAINSNETATITVEVKPDNAANKDYTITVTPTGKGSVNKTTGVVTPVIDFGGTLTILVKSVDGNFTDSVDVVVTEYVAVTSVEVDVAGKKVDVPVLTTYDVPVIVLPSNATNDGVHFSSADPSIASVDPSTGELTAKKMATVVITATSLDKSTIKDTLEVTIVDNPQLIHDYKPAAPDLTVTGSANAWIIDGAQDDNASHLVNLTVVPSTGTYASPSVTVTAGSDVVSVTNIDHANQRFTFTSLKVGTATIQLKSGTAGVDAVVTNITINVTHGVVAVTGVEIAEGDTLNVALSAGTKQLTVNVKPAGATDKSFTASSSDTAVLTVSNTGLITVKKGGSSTVTVTTTDGGFTDNILVNVNDDVNIPVTGVTITEGAAKSFNWDGTAGSNKLTAVVAPANANNKSVTWSVTPAGVVTIDATTGVMAIVKAGTANVKVTTVDGGFTATCAVTIVDKRSVTVTTPTISSRTFYDGGKYPLTLTKVPADGVVTGTWDTTDHTVATIDAAGVLTCLKAGSFGISWTGTDAAGNARTDNSGGGTVSATSGISVTTPSLRDIPAGSTAQMRFTSPAASVIAADTNLKVVYSTTAPAATATIDPDTGIITAKVKDATQYSYKVEIHCGTVVGDSDSSGTYIVDALTSFAAALPASPPAGVTLTGNTLTFANLAGNTANGVTLTLNPTPSTSAVGWITATSAAVSKCTVTDPNPNPGSQGGKQTIVIKPVAVDATGTKVTVTAFGKTLELTVITSAA